jgi:hypothetical protein
MIGQVTGGTRTFDGEIAHAQLDNFLRTAAEVKDLISGNIPFKWQGASQTELIADVNDRTFAAASNWVDDSMDSYSEATNAQVVSSTASGQTVTLATGNAPMTTGKRYRLTYDASSLSGDGFEIRDAGNSRLDISNDLYIFIAGTQVEHEFTYKGASGGLRIYSVGTGAITIDNYTLVALGAVALYTQDSISETTWFDKSSNSNDGAVTGASVLNDDIPAYLENTYNPTVVCSTSGSYVLTASRDTLSYTKIGRMVHIYGEIDIASASSPVGDIRVSLPYTVAASLGDFSDVSFAGGCMLQGGGSAIGTAISAYPVRNTTYLVIKQIDYASGGSPATITNADVDTAFGIDFNLWFMTTTR